MRGHLQCRDTLAGNEGCPLKTGTTVSANRGGNSIQSPSGNDSGFIASEQKVFYGVRI